MSSVLEVFHLQAEAQVCMQQNLNAFDRALFMWFYCCLSFGFTTMQTPGHT